MTPPAPGAIPRLATTTVADSFTVSVIDDDGNVESRVINVTVKQVNDNPVITSGGDTATYSIIENTTAVAALTASDIDGDTVTWSILAGNEGNRFNINLSGQLTFITAPDYESPTDAAPTNSYIVNVQASDGHGGTDTQAITVNVTNNTADDNHAPVANDDKWLISNDTKAALPIAALIGNDTDADGNSLSVTGLKPTAPLWVTTRVTAQLRRHQYHNHDRSSGRRRELRADQLRGRSLGRRNDIVLLLSH